MAERVLGDRGLQRACAVGQALGGHSLLRWLWSTTVISHVQRRGWFNEHD